MDQILNGNLTTLVSGITSSQTTSIQVVALPVAYNTTSGAIATATFSGANSMIEALTFTGVTGTGPYTLTGVVRGVEGTATAFATGYAVAIADLTAGSIQRSLISTGGGIVLPPVPTGGTAALIIVDTTALSTSLPAWCVVPHAGSTQVICDGASAATYLDTFIAGTQARGVINIRTANGTAASPTQSTAGMEIGRLGGRGFSTDGGNAFTGTLSAVSFFCDENTTSTSQGASVGIRTTAIGTVGGGSSTIPTLIAKFHPSGGFSLFTGGTAPSDPGAGVALFQGGIKGSVTNDNAAASMIGEYISATLASGSAVSLTTGTVANVTSISLTAGDWDVTGVIDTVQAATPSLFFIGGVSTTSATFGAQDTSVGAIGNENLIAGVDFAFAAPVVRFSLASTTTVYLVVKLVTTATGTTAYGTIRARRMR